MSSHHAAHDGNGDQEEDQGSAIGKEETLEEMLDEGEEEIEDDPRQYPYATIARIDVTPNPFSLKKGVGIQKCGKIPRQNLVERVPLPHTTNPFHTLLHSYQLENTPVGELPSFWNMDHSERAEKGSFGPEVKEEWGTSTKSWDSPMDRLMSRVENNSEMIHNISFQIEDLKIVIEKLIEAIQVPSKNQA